MKTGSGKPVVGATLVVARSRHQPVFISLYGLCKAMVIPAKERHPELGYGAGSNTPLRDLRALCGELSNLTSKNALPTMNVSQERFPAGSPRPAKPRETT